MLRDLYDRVMALAAHRLAVWWLMLVSFIESSVFPIPPDVMLVPMAVRRPRRAAWFAILTTIASVAGAVLGYVIGYYAIGAILPWIESAGMLEEYEAAVLWFRDWGLWVVLLAGFTPLPYKAFTIAAGGRGPHPQVHVAGAELDRLPDDDVLGDAVEVVDLAVDSGVQ